MMRLRSLRLGLSQLRFFRLSPASRDQVMDQLQACSGEDQVLEVVGRHKAKLSVGHVGCAMDRLWHLQKKRPEHLRTIDQVRAHPQFLTLCVLAENKISQMDDDMVVDVLYDAHRLGVESHDSLIQQLVTEAWNRLDRVEMPALSKFTVSLIGQHHYHSTLMGEITEIVRQKLHLINDVRVLSTLMSTVSALASPRLQDALSKKASILLDSMDVNQYNNPRRVVQFMRYSKHMDRELLEKCNRLLLLNVERMHVQDLFLISGLYQGLQFNNCDFRLASRQRLLELVDASSDPLSFAKLFALLGPMADQETRERLENMALLLADELSGQQALTVAETLEELNCRNPQLISKFASVLHKHLDHYRPMEVARVTHILTELHYQSPAFYNRLRNIMLQFLQTSVYPYEVTALMRVLSRLPSPRLDDAALARVEAVLPQCNLSDLNNHAQSIAKLLRYDPTYLHHAPSRYVSLLQSLIRCGHERLGHADRLGLLVEELRYMTGEWFEEMLLEESVAACRRLADQIAPGNMADMAVFLTRSTYLSPHLLDRIAEVTLENIQQIHYSSMYAILVPFSLLNYDTPLVDEMFNACIQHLTPHISSFDPHLLVLLAHLLAMADYFPKEIIKEIFTVNFLGKLDSQLETLSDTLNWRIRQRLMELNRAVCLECPEHQVPWFHDRYCRQQQRRADP
ncbi:FAST kinase domain-containing protein 1, mitochondrial isoform X2 [Sardina pilchardus]|uniref:FAST kinase domain-containing protein 1, mitochondrial isoform X2 n=1 Tax=Sardina pilchardus TaxID=27697 RepID=UPI002E10D082